METVTYPRNVAVGLFDTRDKAETAVSALYAAGFTTNEIGIVARQTAEWVGYEFPAEALEVDKETGESVVSGAAVGAATGAGIGGLWALGIAAGLLSPIGPIVAGGILGSLIASAAAGAAAGGIVGALVGLGIPEEEASYYNTRVAAGSTLVTVRAGSRYNEALEILRDHGGVQIPPPVSAAAPPVGPMV